ncbi:hypothetical protein F7725_018761 [Dissostichus mawsoni]|uniref:Uncharacterized protein n=1 Tax=Dissostichus mawsoni TaxID=36200 RepID=A0A7J5XSD3_DISMA|nr:hypothetical protein F7725_018761 [Dissostichus mawsoni]
MRSWKLEREARRRRRRGGGGREEEEEEEEWRRGEEEERMMDGIRLPAELGRENEEQELGKG